MNNELKDSPSLTNRNTSVTDIALRWWRKWKWCHGIIFVRQFLWVMAIFWRRGGFVETKIVFFSLLSKIIVVIVKLHNLDFQKTWILFQYHWACSLKVSECTAENCHKWVHQLCECWVLKHWGSFDFCVQKTIACESSSCASAEISFSFVLRKLSHMKAALVRVLIDEALRFRSILCAEYFRMWKQQLCECWALRQWASFHFCVPKTVACEHSSCASAEHWNTEITFNFVFRKLSHVKAAFVWVLSTKILFCRKLSHVRAPVVRVPTFLRYTHAFLLTMLDDTTIEFVFLMQRCLCLFKQQQQFWFKWKGNNFGPSHSLFCTRTCEMLDAKVRCIFTRRWLVQSQTSVSFKKKLLDTSSLTYSGH